MHPGQPPASSTAAHRRALLTLITVAIGLIAVFAAIAAFLIAAVMAPEATPKPRSTSPAAGAPAASPPGPAWDLAAQAELATRPMPVLPDTAARPHQLTTQRAGPALKLPTPAPGTATGTGAGTGQLVPGGFPRTPEGAVAQLVALTEVGLTGADPDTYARAYASLASPGAPDATTTRLYRDLVRLRAAAGLAPSGPAPELTLTWTATSGLVKGTTDAGAYTVVCVLGELVVAGNGRSIASGAGDCQALRWEAAQWRISPGPPAAPAPLAWPGTAEAAKVGYREVS